MHIVMRRGAATQFGQLRMSMIGDHFSAIYAVPQIVKHLHVAYLATVGCVNAFGILTSARGSDVAQHNGQKSDPAPKLA
jgi:hypothetical protein